MRAFNFDKKNGNLLDFTVCVDGDEYRSLLEKESKIMQAKNPISGFREGKAPLDVAESVYKERLYQSVASKEMTPLFARAVIENKLEPVSKPMFSILCANGDKLEFAATVQVYPDVILRQYKGLEVERERDYITEDELDNLMDAFCDQHRNVVASSEPASDDDIVYLSYVAECDGRNITGAIGSHATQRLDRESIFPGICENIKGKVANDEIEYEIDLPEDFKIENVAGKRCKVFVRVEEVKKRLLLPISDELVHKYNKDCNTVTEYREKVRKEQNKYKKMSADEKFSKSVKEKLAQQVEANIPSAMLDFQIQILYSNLESGLHMMGKTIEQFMDEEKITLADIHRTSMPVAETEVKFSLACSEISKLEGFELSEDELANEYIKIARKEKITEEAARNKYPKEDIEEDIFSRRAFELVKSTAVAIPMSE